MLKEVDATGEPFIRNHGERVPGGQVRSNTSCGRDARRHRPGRTNRRAARFANPTTTWLEARSVLRNRKLKIKPLDAWDFCKHNVNGKVVTPTPRNELQRVSGYVSSQGNGSQEGSNPCTRPRVAAKTDDRVLQQRCRPIDPDLLERLGHIVSYESARWLKHGLAIRQTRSHSSPFRVSLGVLTERQNFCG